MAFRTETKACAGVIFALALASPAAAQTKTYDLRQGRLTIDANSIAFEERGRRPKRSRRWAYDDIRELVLAPGSLRIVSYEDKRWKLGARIWQFDKTPAAIAGDWYPVFAKALDQRFVAALADDAIKPEWQVPAKLTHTTRAGSQGVILVSADHVVYKSEQPGESRTWRIKDIENSSSSGPFDLTIATHERDFHFQLKQPLPATRFDELWRRVNLSNGLQILSSSRPEGEQK